jgi:hypothetical protein
VEQGIVDHGPAVAQQSKLLDVGAAGRGVTVKLDRARVRGLHEVRPLVRQLPGPGLDRVPADLLDVGVGDPHHGVVGEQRHEPVQVAHHRRVGELAAKRLDLDPVGDSLQIAHGFLRARWPVCFFSSTTTQALELSGGRHLTVRHAALSNR